MPPTKIMLIRHGEKQDPDVPPPPYSINADGMADPHSLTVRGWQRAGALAPFFVRPWVAGIAAPDVIYASKVGDAALVIDGHDVSKSLRPQQTVTPLAAALGLAGVQTPCAVGEESNLCDEIRAQNGIVLVAWEHHHIPNIAAAFSPDAPVVWHGSHFDLVWLLDRAADGTYAFSEMHQALLPGD